MFIKDGKRFNPYTTIEHDGVVYQGNVLSFPDTVTALGISEVQEPLMPEDYNPDFYFREETLEAPYVVYTPKSPEQVRQARLALIPSITPWQIRKALNQLGLRDAIEQAVAGADQTTKDAWEFATEFVRTDPLIATIQAVLGKTDEEVDALFILGSTL